MKSKQSSVMTGLLLGLFFNLNNNISAQTASPTESIHQAAKEATGSNTATSISPSAITPVGMDEQEIKVEPMAFRRGCFLLSVSEGYTRANYSTNSIRNIESPFSSSSFMDGERDPLFIEFALTNTIGIGFSTGADIFTVNPNQYYGFKLKDNQDVQATTSELTFDLNYHYLVGRKTDLSLYGSLGSFGVTFSGKNGDADYNYKAKGGIIRVGTKARYYFCKRLGVLGMVSLYSGTASPKDIKGVTVGNNINTTIKGYALEFGLCYRFF